MSVEDDDVVVGLLEDATEDEVERDVIVEDVGVIVEEVDVIVDDDEKVLNGGSAAK